jgi:tetratricopeptide (TPR) repeat protein
MARPAPQALAERVAQLRDILARDPGDATAWFGFGRALFDLDRPGEAIDAFRRALEIDPDYTAARRDLGRSLLASGAAQQAARTLREGIELAERTGDLQTGREMEVFLRRAQRALGEAPASRRAPAETPEASARPQAQDAGAAAQARALYKRGFARFAADDFDAAIDLYAQALELDPGLAIAWNGLSLAQRQRGALDEAIRAGRHLVELEPEDPLSHTNLSILYQRKGMIPEAEEERAIAMQIQLRSQRGA